MQWEVIEGFLQGDDRNLQSLQVQARKTQINGDSFRLTRESPVRIRRRGNHQCAGVCAYHGTSQGGVRNTQHNERFGLYRLSNEGDYDDQNNQNLYRGRSIKRKLPIPEER